MMGFFKNYFCGKEIKAIGHGHVHSRVRDINFIITLFLNHFTCSPLYASLVGHTELRFENLEKFLNRTVWGTDEQSNSSYEIKLEFHMNCLFD